MNLTEFLLARIAEDEAAACGSQGGGWSTGGVRMVSQPEGTEHWESAAPGWVLVEPRHVLAECEARRRIIGEHANDYGSCVVCLDGDDGGCSDPECCGGASIMMKPWPCPTIRILSLPFADHHDYDPEWRRLT